MKSLSTGTTLLAARRHAEPVYLMQIDFTSPSSTTLRLSDRTISAMGSEWHALVSDWGTLEETLNTLDPDGRPQTAEITLLNACPIEGKSRLSDLIRTPRNDDGSTYEWAFAQCTIYQLLAPTADAITLGVFYLEDPTEIGLNVLRVRMTDQSLLLEHGMRSTIISRADFASASTDVIGQSIPALIGVIKDVPALPVVAGVVNRVSGALSSGATTVPLVDAADFPSSGTAQIDTEQITYTGKTATSLTGVTRGANSTTAAAHTDQAAVYEVRTGTSAYRFVVGEHTELCKLKSVTNVRVDGYLAQAATVTLDETALASGKRLALINFTPSDVAQFHVIPFGPYPISVTALSASVPNGGDASATRTVTTPSCERLSGPHTRAVSFTVTVGGASPTAVSWAVSRRQTGGVFAEIARGLGNNSAGSDAREYVGTANDEIKLDISLPAATAGSATVVFNSYAVSAPRGDSNSTAEAVIGKVTCDVEGMQDDTSGTLSGTPSLLLENPSDVTKLVLREFYGVTTFGASFALTRSGLGGYKWATRLERMAFSALRRKLSEQARSMLYLEGGVWEYRLLDASPTPQKTLDYASEVWADVAADVSRTARTDIHNRLTVMSGLNYALGKYRRAQTVEDLTDFAVPQADTLELDLVQDSATADLLAAYWLAWRKRQHFVVDLVTWWNALDVEKIDYVAITNHPILEAHGGANLIFRIVAKSYLLGDENPGRIRLRLVEVPAQPGDRPIRRRLGALPGAAARPPWQPRRMLVP